jgi:ParB family transcriptional regulator, chromosome partitioning protein
VITRVFPTPRTALTWATLDEWLRCAWRIEHRRASALRTRQAMLHVRALPLSVIDQCSSRATLAACHQLLRNGPPRFCQPPRGQRQNAPHTSLIVAIANRLARIDRAEDQASIPSGHNSRTASPEPQAALPYPPRLPPVPAARPASKRAARGFVTGFSRARDSSCPPVTETPAMTKKSAARHVSRSADAAEAEPQETPAVAKVTNICLRQLVPSPANVRKTPATAAEDAELEASIRAKGILQNLIVHPMPLDGKPVYLVDAGGRRLTILQKLAAEGVIDGDYPVPCLVRDPEASVETSLMENTVRAAMHPADEFVAMAALIDGGATIDDVTKRFGTSERHVKQRLRLGKLAPELLDAYRNGEISLDTVTAFTLGADHAAQLAVWSQLKDHSYIQPYTVKRLLTQTAVPLDSDLGQFVGAAAYEAAGGTITRDLFSGDDDGFLDDPALVRRLAIEKLEAKAEELRPQWAWTKAVLEAEYRMLHRYDRIEPRPGKIPDDLAAEIERIEQRLAEFENLDGEDWTDELSAEMTQLEGRRAEIDEIVESLAVYTKKDRKRAGCIVTIGSDGRFELHQGLVEPVAAASDADESDPAAADGDNPFIPGSDDEDDDRGSRPSSAGAEQALRKECGFSQSLVDDLKAHRHQITRAYLAGNFDVAFDLALYTLAADLFDRFRYHGNPLELRAIEATPRSSLNDLSGTPADRLLEAQGAGLALDWQKLPPAAGFAALSALPPEAKRRLFAWCIASCLKPQLAIEDHAHAVLESAGHRLAIPFADLWRPTAANYWGRVKKAHGLGIGRAILGERWARDHADDKKATLAEALHNAFDPALNQNCIGLAQTARDSAAAWLPPGMAYAAANGDTGGADPVDADAGEDSEIALDPPALPAFLTEEEPAAPDDLPLAAE